MEGLFFKDLKQTMKKEQCEVKLLVTASMPGQQADLSPSLHNTEPAASAVSSCLLVFRNQNAGGARPERVRHPHPAAGP